MSAIGSPKPAQLPHNQEHAKTHLEYWKKHIFHAVKGKPVIGPDGKPLQGPDRKPVYPYKSVNFYMDVSTRGRRKKLCLGTPNQEAAARRAQAIYCDIQNMIPLMGAEKAVATALEKYRPTMPTPAPLIAAEPQAMEVTIGDWIAHAKSLFAGKQFFGNFRGIFKGRLG